MADPVETASRERRSVGVRFCLVWSNLLAGCGPFLGYTYDTSLPAVIEIQDGEVRRVSNAAPEPVPPALFGSWLMPSSWAVRLAARWGELPFAFDASGPEYFAALGVDKARMIHASAVVRYRKDIDVRNRCPPLVWEQDLFVIGLGIAHSHQTRKANGERISSADAGLGSLVLNVRSAPMLEVSPIAVNFYSGERLVGLNPATGNEEPVPVQSLLITKVGGVLRVFLWTPVKTMVQGRIDSVEVYKPSSNDGWESVGKCWTDVADLQQAAVSQSVPPARCDPDEFWLK